MIIWNFLFISLHTVSHTCSLTKPPSFSFHITLTILLYLSQTQQRSYLSAISHTPNLIPYLPTYLPTYDAHNLFSTYFQIKILVYTSQLFLCRGVCLTFSLVRVCEKCLKTKSWNSQKNSELLYLISHTQIFPAINLVSTEFTKYSK